MSTTRRRFVQSVPAFAVAGHLLMDSNGANAATAPVADDHFHPVGKEPSEFTKAIIHQARASLPFDDKRDFEEEKKGLIAKPNFTQIKDEEGNVIWDMGRYNFLLEGKDWPTIHPSLQRIAILNMSYGLYEVTPGIYQVRGFDLAVITFVKGKTGWIVFDTGTYAEGATAALKLVNEKLGERPVVAVVYSHTHADHFGGVAGLVNENDVRNGKVKIIAPEGFMHYSIAENIFAGPAMNRRVQYMYAMRLPAGHPYGQVDQGIGKKLTRGGTVSLISPTILIAKPLEELTVDGVKMVFQNTPNTEAPVEMNTYFPDLKALWMAENVTATIHNVLTWRGALVRDPLQWSKKLNETIYLFGNDVEVMFASHNWPRWGNERIIEVLKDQRDIYANLNNSVLNLANKGVTINQVHNVYKVPSSLQKKWHARSYHGSVENNSRAVIQRYLGYWDHNPATLFPLEQQESAKLFVGLMGGASKIISKGQQLHDEGKYLHAIEILNKLVYAEPENQEGKELLADCFEQVGYQTEGSSARNVYLSAAFELRDGITEEELPTSTSPGVIRALTTEMFLDQLGIKVNSERAEEMEFTINIIVPDKEERFVVEMRNSTLTTIEGFLAPNPDLSLTINHSDIVQAFLGTTTLENLFQTGVGKFDGDIKILERLKSTLDTFTTAWEIMPGTLKKNSKSGSKTEKDEFQVDYLITDE
jgi:alkyl sulfatase BDS1-like metallo-beta-lactamase superfamily hydrolase